MSEAGTWAAIAAGGAAGALLRWALLQAAARIDPGWATLAANLIACGVLGAASSRIAASGADPAGLGSAGAAFLTTGLCGSLSTFSTLCADVLRQALTAPRARVLVFLAAHLLGGPLAHRLGAAVAG